MVLDGPAAPDRALVQRLASDQTAVLVSAAASLGLDPEVRLGGFAQPQPAALLARPCMRSGWRGGLAGAGPMAFPERLTTSAEAVDLARRAGPDAETEAADRSGDDGRSSAAQAERTALLAELPRATRLGRPPRRAGRDAERTRVNTTKALRTAVARIATAAAPGPRTGRCLLRGCPGV
ncbi:hypothetical protein [Actinoplanes sp. NPDC051411]|uniref:hypothetical protein n=1 Tax=Actinoplanes sp. NPDC051411 TaxID=3155522 RepID=UPI00343ECA43